MRERSSLSAVAVVVLAVAAVVAAGLLAVGCGKKSEVGRTNTATSPSTQSSSPAGTPSSKNTVAIFLLKEEAVFQVNRVVGSTGASEALAELLKGPVSAEEQEGLSTAIPKGTRLISYKVENGKAVADFSSELKNYGGGSARVQAIMNQITNTVTANDKAAKSVEITIAGVPAEESLQP